MKKEEKTQLIETLTEQLKDIKCLYITDISKLNVEKTNQLRRLCYKRDVRLMVVKNTLLRKALEKTGKDYTSLFPVLNGSTSIMFAEMAKDPAKLIQEFRKTNPKPILKGAYVEEMTYLGDDQLPFLISIKSKNELVGDLVALLQSPARNVISALQSGGGKLAGILKALSEKEFAN
ncbi:MAG: 50S ribosomal protein L10 [Bacteroidales bacterium]|nr:50S ribosomal protein L10 [Bacteroidales bacterium]MDZ4204764.1 50S ribosomal protein L10 [Bacteroidales bacterium]